MLQSGIRRGSGFIVTADARIREAKAVESTDLLGIFFPLSLSHHLLLGMLEH